MGAATTHIKLICSEYFFEIDCDVISIYWTNFYLSRHHVVIHVVIFEIDTFLWGSIPSGEGV